MSEIVTGDAVVVDLPCARFPTRSLGHVIDMLVQIPLLIGIAVGAASMSDDAAAAAVWAAGYVLVLVGYPVIFETLSRGKTLGKMALGLRAVSDDGGPIRFRQALVRGLAGAVECWALLGVPALIASLFSARGRRLGDIFAGTFVLRERVPPAAPTPLPPSYAPPAPGAAVPPAPGAAVPPAPGAPVPPGGMPPAPPVAAFGQVPLPPPNPALAGWAASLDLSALPDALASSAASYLSRYWELHAPARDQLALQLASDISARVTPPPPPGLPPVAYLGAVLAERRDRELRRYAAQSAPQHPSTSRPLAPPSAPQPPAASGTPSSPQAPAAPVPPAAPAPPPAPGDFVPPA